MPQSHPLLGKLADALAQSAVPFKLENARLAALPQEVQEASALEPRYPLAPEVWLDFKADAGVEAAAGPDPEQSGLRLQVRDAGSSPWFSFSYELDAAPLREGRYLGQIIRSSSRGTARFRICLRYIFAEGFRDVFARDVVVLTGGDAQEDLLVVPLDADLAERAERAEVLFFFEGRSFDATLHGIEAFLV